MQRAMSRGLQLQRAMSRLAVLVLLLAACDVGSVLPEENGSTPDAGGGGSGSGTGSGGGGASPLTITLTSSPSATAVYAPQNVLAVWIETQAGAIVKTISRYSSVRTQYLVAWNQKAGGADTDAVSGASRTTHAQPMNVGWDLKDRQGTVVPDGTYTIRMETADQNSVAANQNNQGTFTFVKGPQPQTQTGLTSGGFSNVNVTFTP
jgi:hypothetical protein